MRLAHDTILDLDHCVVCQKKFSHELNKHMHHCIPQAYGGVDGPQVSLCSPHHSALHAVADLLYSGKPFTSFLSGDKQQDKRLTYLATIVLNARRAVENDPNKMQTIVLHVNKEFKDKLKRLKTVYSGSTRELVERAVLSLYKKHFID